MTQIQVFNFNNFQLEDLGDRDPSSLSKNEELVDVRDNEGVTIKTFQKFELERFNNLLDNAEEAIEERRNEKGAPLTDKQTRKAIILRATDTRTNTFKPMDYVLVNPIAAIAPLAYKKMEKFLEGDLDPKTAQEKLLSWVASHAQTMSVSYEDDHHVIAAVVDPKYLFEATNTGEYFYDGPIIEGKVAFGVNKLGLYEEPKKENYSERTL